MYAAIFSLNHMEIITLRLWKKVQEEVMELQVALQMPTQVEQEEASSGYKQTFST
jgi:hypothetical protein